MPRFEVPLHEIEAEWEKTDIEDAGIVAEGWYKAEIKDFETRRKDENSSPYIQWRFQIQDGEFDGMPVWDITSLSSKSIWKLKALATASNLLLTKEVALIDQLYALVGRQVAIQVFHDTYNGQKRAKISMYATVDTGNLGTNSSDSPDDNKGKDVDEIPF